MGSSLAMAGLPGLCCSTEEAPAGSFSLTGRTLTINLQLARALDRSGGAVKIIDPAHRLNLLVVQSARGRFHALERSCTHGGAQVIYNRRNKTVRCTSWGHSEFALDGTVLGGSAKLPLGTWPAVRIGRQLRIELGEAAA